MINTIKKVSPYLLVISILINIVMFYKFKGCNKASISPHQTAMPQEQSTIQDKSPTDFRIDYPSFKVRNPLVVTMGYYKYFSRTEKHKRDLPGSKKAMADFKNLYEKEYGYEVISSLDEENSKDGFLTMKSAINFLRKVQKILEEDKKYYDGLIILVSGHGDNDQFICSDTKRIPYSKIIQFFDLSNLPSFVGRPKIIFFDACRGEHYDDGINIDGEFHANEEDFVLIYHNTLGYQVRDQAIEGESSHFMYQFIDFVKNVPQIRNSNLMDQFRVASNNVRSLTKGKECPIIEVKTGKKIFFLKNK